MTSSVEVVLEPQVVLHVVELDRLPEITRLEMTVENNEVVQRGHRQLVVRRFQLLHFEVVLWHPLVKLLIQVRCKVPLSRFSLEELLRHPIDFVLLKQDVRVEWLRAVFFVVLGHRCLPIYVRLAVVNKNAAKFNDLYRRRWRFRLLYLQWDFRQ